MTKAFDSDSSNFQNKSSDALLQDIFDENYPDSPNKPVFERFLNAILMSLDCDKPQKDSVLFAFNCGPDGSKNTGIHFHLKMFLTENKLNSLFEFFSKYTSANKDTLSRVDIEKLIFLGTHYTTMYEVKINEKSSTYSGNDILTTSSFIKFLSSLFNIHNITEFETPGLIHKKIEGSLPNITFGTNQTIDALVGDTIKLSENLIHILDYKKYNYSKESLDFLKNLGNFGFELKIKEEFQDYSHKIPEIAKIIISSTNLKDFSKGDAGYAFLSGFNNGDINQIKSDCVDLLDLENCPRPVTPSIQLFQRIAQGNYFNQKPPFADFVQVKGEIRDNFSTLDRNQHIHILDFLKNVLKANSRPENTFNFKSLYGFAFDSINNLSNDLQQKNMLNDSFAQAAENLSFFLFNIVKNNVKNEALFDQIHIIDQYKKLYVDIIIQAPHLKSLLDTMGNHLFSIFDRNIDSPPALQEGHNVLLKSINDVNKVCRENHDTCNLPKILARSFKSLGSISRKSSGYAINATNEAKTLIEATSTYLNPEQLSGAVSFFFKANISQIELDRQCKQKFNLTGCRPASLINLDNLVYGAIDEIVTTILPEEHLIDANNLTSTTSAPQIAVPTSLSNQTTPEVILNPAIPGSPISELPSTTEIVKDIAQNLGSRLPTATEIGATAAHSFGSSLINIMTQATSMWLRSKGYGKSKISALSLSLAGGILQASYMATFPLMLFNLNALVAQGNEEEAQAQWEMMTQNMLPTFFNTLGLSTGLQLLNYLSENYLSKQSTIKGLVQSIPTLSTLWNFSQNPILTGIHAATAYGVSAAGLLAVNRYFGARNYRPSDVEVGKNENDHEMQPLNEEEKESNKTDFNTVVSTEKDLTPEEIFFKKIEFTTPEQFKKLKEYLHTIILSVRNLQTNLSDQTHIDRLEKILDVPTYKLGLHYDLIDLEDFPNKFITAYNKCKNDEQKLMIVKNNFDYFKTMIKTMYDKLLSDNVNNDCLNFILCSIKETKTLKSSITDSIKLIENNLSFIRGITKPIVSIHLSQEPSLTCPESLSKNGHATILRKNTKSVTHANNRHTFHASSDSNVRFSSASSSDESAKSDGYGNSALNNIDEQQQEPLMNTRLAY